MRTASIYGIAAGLVVLLAVVVVAASTQNILYGLLALGGVFVVVWLFLPRKPDVLPRRLVIFLAAFTFGSILPQSIGAPLQMVALGGAFIEWLFKPAAERRGGPIVLAAALFIGYWALLIFHPNIPDIATGVLGFRKSALAIAGVVLGCSVLDRHRQAAERFIVKLLTLALIVSIIGYFWIPAISALVPRGDADIYTSEFAGENRLQGVFAGPFHVAIAGVFLFGWVLVRWRSNRLLATVVFVVATVATYLTFVRTAYVAMALALVVFVMLAQTFGAFIKKAVAVLVAALVGLMIVEATGSSALDTLASIGNFATDGRFLNRFPEYTLGLKMIGESPLIGQGAGSAGDTLGSAFVRGEHVTAHNLLLKIAVEGGLIGLALWFILLIALWNHIDRKSAEGRLAIISVVGLFGMGITGSAIEALPVTYLIFVIVGLAVFRGNRKGYNAASTSPYVRTATPELAR